MGVNSAGPFVRSLDQDDRPRCFRELCGLPKESPVEESDREVRMCLSFDGDLLFDDVVACSEMPRAEIEGRIFLEKLKKLAAAFAIVGEDPNLFRYLRSCLT